MVKILKLGSFTMEQVNHLQSLSIKEKKVLTWDLAKVECGAKLSTLQRTALTVMVIDINALMVLIKCFMQEWSQEKLFWKIATSLSKCLIYCQVVKLRDMTVFMVSLVVAMSSWYTRTKKLTQSTWSLTSDISLC